MSILMNEIKSSLFCFGDSVVTNLHGIGSSFRISHNLNSLDRRINKLDRIRKAYSEACADGEPEVETPHPEKKSKVVFEKEVSETVEFEENSNVIKKPAEEKVEPVKEEKEPVKEEPKTEENPVETTTESVKEEKIEAVVTKPTEEETPKAETTAEKEPEPIVQQAEAEPKVELKKEDIDKIINIANLQSKTEHKDTARMVADSIISDIINNPNSDLNQKLASNIEQMTKKEEEPKEPVQPKATTKTPTSRKSGTPRKRK